MPLPDTGVAVSALPAASSTGALDLLGVQAGVTKKVPNGTYVGIAGAETVTGDKTLSGKTTFTGPVYVRSDHPFDVRAQVGYDPIAANNAAPFQAAIDAAAVGDKRRTVKAPPGITTVSQLVLTSKPVHIQGDGERGTFIMGNGTAHVIYAVHPTVITGIVLEDLNIQPAAAPQSTFDGVFFQNVDLFALVRVGFGNARYGVNLDLNARMGSITDCVFGSNNVRGANLGAGASFNRIHGNWFDENTDRGLSVNGSDNVIVGNVFLDNTSYDLVIDAAGNDNVVTGNRFGGGTVAANSGCNIYGDRNLIAQNAFADYAAYTAFSTEVRIQAGGDSNIIGPNKYTAAVPRLTDAGTNTTWLDYRPDGLVLGRLRDTNLYRSAADVLKTDDRFVAVGGIDTRVVATASIPAAGASMDGHVLIEDNGVGDRNLIIYAGGQRFRIDGGAAI